MGNIIENKNSTFPAIVAKVLNEYEVIINKGSMHQIKEGQRFLIYRISDEEIIDPETQQSLGYLEIVVGRGKVTHVQERMATVCSDEFDQSSERRITRKSPSLSLYGKVEEEIVSPKEKKPFNSPMKGDKAKPI